MWPSYVIHDVAFVGMKEGDALGNRQPQGVKCDFRRDVR